MSEIIDALALDMLEWIARQPRPYAQVIEAWRTSCPRLTVWEDAVDQNFVRREKAPDGTAQVVMTEAGAAFLKQHGRL